MIDYEYRARADAARSDRASGRQITTNHAATMVNVTIILPAMSRMRIAHRQYYLLLVDPARRTPPAFRRREAQDARPLANVDG